ncbi:DNA topoisomerase 6 subunit B, partial [mine drainage metagenome]
GKPIHAISYTSIDSGYSCDISIDTMHNKPVVSNAAQESGSQHTGLIVSGEFEGVKYDTSDHGVYEYLKRTALSNPHVQIKFVDPNNQEFNFLRSVDTIPERPKAARLHPLGLTVNDILDLAHTSTSNRLSSFLTDTFSRFSQGKVNELKEIVGIDFSMDPKRLTWDDASKLVDGFKKVKWIAPEAAHIVPIGKKYIELTLKNIINPEFMNVVERKPSVFKGGFPFIVEAAIAYGGNSGRQTDGG